MGDMKGLGKAKMELEELYLGIPDESVNLTFQDLAKVKQKPSSSPEKKSSETIHEGRASPLQKLPSLDFNRGFQESKNHHSYHLDHHAALESSRGHEDNYHNRQKSDGHHRYGDGDHGHSGFRHAVEGSRSYDDVSVMSMNSMYQERGGRPRRPGIPHSNICTICSTYIYIFRHRCLVCGRVYCRSCLTIGMGEMPEGRKCIECLGRRFSQRYIQKAGKIRCCLRYPSIVKQAELRWAEKGPRLIGEKAYGHSTMMSRSRSPVNPITPIRAHANTSHHDVKIKKPCEPNNPN